MRPQSYFDGPWICFLHNFNLINQHKNLVIWVLFGKHSFAEFTIYYIFIRRKNNIKWIHIIVEEESKNENIL